MNAAFPVIMFIVGFATGGGILWFMFKKATDQQLADKDTMIADLQGKISQKEHQLTQREEQNTQLLRDKDVLQTTLKKNDEKFHEQTALWADLERRFKDAFEALAAKALKDNNKEFDQLSRPVKDALKELNTKITVVNASASHLGAETAKLVQALRKPDVRGQWGEMHLERVLEITGMSERCDFFRQPVIGDEQAKQRPDVIVRLPGEKQLAVDAKATLQAFLDLVDAPDDETRQAKLQGFVVHIRERIKVLGSKAYHQNIDGSPEFVVLYLPTEGLFCAALSLDPELLEFADSKRILLAGPINLIALLRAVAHGWKQDDVANNAREICRLAEDLYKSLCSFGGHMVTLGKSLNSAVSAYDAAVGSLDGNVVVQARKFEKLGAAPTDKRIPDLAPIEKTTRLLHGEAFKLGHCDGKLCDQDALARPR